MTLRLAQQFAQAPLRDLHPLYKTSLARSPHPRQIRETPGEIFFIKADISFRYYLNRSIIFNHIYNFCTYVSKKLERPCRSFKPGLEDIKGMTENKDGAEM